MRVPNEILKGILTWENLFQVSQTTTLVFWTHSLSGSTDRKIFYFNFYFSLALRYSNLQVSGGVRIDVLSAGSTEFHSIAYHVTMHAIGCLQLWHFANFAIYWASPRLAHSNNLIDLHKPHPCCLLEPNHLRSLSVKRPPNSIAKLNPTQASTTPTAKLLPTADPASLSTLNEAVFENACSNSARWMCFSHALL